MALDLLAALREGVSSEPRDSRPAGIEIRQALEPAGGLPVQPPSYEGRLEIHKRHVDGDSGEPELREAIELDSVGSCANRIEEALLELHRSGDYPLPVSDTTIPIPNGDPVTITTLEAPHRIFDAWLRLSASDGGGGTFESSERGLDLAQAHLGALDPILEASAHDLVLGAWDSHRKGPNGQLRIARALTGSVIGLDPEEQAQFAARRDPLNLGDGSDAGKDAKRLSEKGLSSLPPQRSIPYEEDDEGNPKGFGGRVTNHRGGVSITGARYLGYLSFPALRRLGFSRYEPVAVRTLLASLALYGVALRCAQGWDLRARCALLASGTPELRLVHADGRREPIELSLEGARSLFDELVREVSVEDRSVHLQASDELESLVAKSVVSA
jgi:CRISPR-associated protein Csb1